MEILYQQMFSVTHVSEVEASKDNQSVDSAIISLLDKHFMHRLTKSFFVDQIQLTLFYIPTNIKICI